MQTGYEPLNTLKPVGEGLWLIDGPFVTVRRLPHPSRATVAKLESGELWVHCPTKLTDELRDELAALGPVSQIVCSNTQDPDILAEWQAAYPAARIWRPSDFETRPDWANEIDLKVLAGSHTTTELAFFHRKTESMIVSDMIANIETEKLPTWARPFIWFAATDDPDGKMPASLRRVFRNRDALADSILEIIEWRPRRIILCHGRWYERNAVAELERAFRKVLRDRLWMKAMDDIEARER